ncbi:hypothetical protein [Kaistella antarctica]|uniref:Uncharacterized protein n=1 Tax=Kaistella antarctica TaxID=266748 RepID=A0A3S4YQY9_9FLAO|nr:hypothetical protein [Kaistella antarctica]KEY19557.1 hypothetical protein HY04_14290 [Kaistella antarctica]SEW08342.1 hypothetical protein SAMN05421765_2304 [Kaistella antarctica]VEH97136.1 Uncharacterised protein [Kaistella antarctica]
MKFNALFIFLLCFGLVSGQKSQQFIFKFNVKKWNQEFTKQQKLTRDGVSSINLFDVDGKPVLFKVSERSISEVAVPDLKILKGKSADNQKIISLTILAKSMSGAYLENGLQYFIEPVKGSCNKYKVYIKPNLNEKGEVGQINDHLK